MKLHVRTNDYKQRVFTVSSAPTPTAFMAALREEIKHEEGGNTHKLHEKSKEVVKKALEDNRELLSRLLQIH